jgi:hypothetical protein
MAIYFYQHQAYNNFGIRYVIKEVDGRKYSMTDQGLRQLAISLALGFYVLTKLIVSPALGLPEWVAYFLPSTGVSFPELSSKILAATISAIELGLLLTISEMLVYRVFARKYLGRWIYKSSNTGYGIAEIAISGLWTGGVHLRYNVTLMESEQAVLSLLTGKRAPEPIGTARGLLVGLTQDQLHIAYEVSQGIMPKDDGLVAKRGFLVITPLPHGNFLKGVWESSKKNYDKDREDSLRQGDLDFLRPSEFIRRYSIN